MEFAGGPKAQRNPVSRIVRNFHWKPCAEDGTAVALGGGISTNCQAWPAAATNKSAFAVAGSGSRITALPSADEEVVGLIGGGGTGSTLLSSNPFLPPLKPASNIGDDVTLSLYRHLFRVARSVAGTPAEDFFGIYFHPYATTIPASPGTTGPGYGVVGDGAGGWKFIARKTSGGPLTFNQALAWPAAVTRLVDVDFRIVPPTAAVGARLQLRIGTTLVVDENWDNSTLPYISDGIGASGQYGWSIRNQNAAYPDLYVARIDEIVYAGTV